MKDTSANTGLKQAAALEAAAWVKSGQTVGLGTGSTAAFAIAELGRRVREEGLQVRCTATSYQSLRLAQSAGLHVLPPDSFSELDLSIDGADEIDPDLHLIKGGGAAHTREKIVHAMARRFVVVADSSKQVERLGERFAVPVEVLASALSFVERELVGMGAQSVTLRAAVHKDGPVITDNGNMVLDARMTISDPLELERSITLLPGVVENGIFARPEVRPQAAIIAAESGLLRLGAHG